MTISNNRLFQLFKYGVYALLTVNIFVFWNEEVLAAALQYPNGIGIAQVIGSFPATIDTTAWVVLLLMFELETCVLDDHQFTRPVAWSLQAVRALCYTVIIYAFYGYVVKLTFIYEAATFVGLSDLCTLVSGGWSYAIDLDEYTLLSAGNCSGFSSAGTFFQFEAMSAVVDGRGLRDILNLAWVDVINAGVWLVVVLVLEVDVWLQERKRNQGVALRMSRAIKVVLYSLLLLAAIYWGVKGDFVDFWDAFLWLVAFVFIEMNVFEWRQETNESAQLSQNPG